MNRQTVLRVTALLAGVVQLLLGLGYLFAPREFNESLGLGGLPEWAGWPLGLLGARFIALGFGMLLVYRAPVANRHWIQVMIVVQTVDWLVVVTYLAAGTLHLSEVATAPFLPLIFVAGLVAGYPRSAATPAAAEA